MDEVGLIEYLKAMWEEIPKNVSILESRSQRRFRLLFEFRELQINLELQIGPRGGITEIVHALDPSKTVLLDQLIVNSAFTEGDGCFIDRPGLRKSLSNGYDPVRAGLAALDAVRKRIQNNPDFCYTNLMMARDEPGRSLATVSGGLPTLGKRR